MAEAAPDSREIDLPDPAATEALGARLGAILGLGDVVCLRGDLGAGKTTLARGAVSAWLGRAEETPSPTYTLAQVYDGPKGPLWHMDLYRLTAPEEALELGLEEAFETATCLIEWPERLGPFMPADRLDITLRTHGEGRIATLAASGRWKDRLHEF